MHNQWEEITQTLYKEDNYLRMEEVFGFILSQIPQEGNLKILDIGCGDGSLLARLKNTQHELYGVDVAKEQLEIARENGLEAEYLNLDDNPLPFENDFFDIIICSEVIEHVLLPDNILKEAFRTLKGKGQFILTTPNLASFGKRLLLLGGRNPFIEVSPLEEKAVGHLRYFIYPTLLNLTKKYNFKLKKFTSDVINFDGKGRLKSEWLARMFPSLGRTLMFILEKDNHQI